jgi:lysophospholipase L1-like esterase
MNKLWIFGDSFSEPYAKEIGIQWQTEYLKWKTYIPKVYGEIVTERLNLKHTNLAKGGVDNYTILDSIINVINTISPNDIIIIGWSTTLRYRVVNKNNNFTTIKAKTLDVVFKENKNQSLFDLSDTTLTEMAINRCNPIYINELNNYIKLINFSFPNNTIIHWSPFYLDRNGLNTTMPTINEYERISEETHGIIDDAHFSEKGNINVAENIINAIDSYTNPKFKKNVL